MKVGVGYARAGKYLIGVHEHILLDPIDSDAVQRAAIRHVTRVVVNGRFAHGVEVHRWCLSANNIGCKGQVAYRSNRQHAADVHNAAL